MTKKNVKDLKDLAFDIIPTKVHIIRSSMGNCKIHDIPFFLIFITGNIFEKIQVTMRIGLCNKCHLEELSKLKEIKKDLEKRGLQ